MMDKISESGTTQASGGQSHLPFWEAGSGHYGATLGQKNRQILSSSIDLLLSYIETIPVDKNGVFTIGDYGTNDGYSSMPLMCRVIERLRQKHGEGLSIQIIYEDQEQNDFHSLFRRLSHNSSYMSKFNNVYPMATNVSFYKRCVPDGSCDVILSTIATHWMEKLDVTFKDCVFHVFCSQEERARFSLEVDRDWTKFLMLRAKELKPNGLLIVMTTCTRCPRDPVPGEITPAAPDTAEPETACIDILQGLEQAWTQLKDNNSISQEEYEKCTAKMCFRNAEENQRPLVGEDSVVQQAGLRLVHYDEIFAPCVYKDFWRCNRSHTANEEKQRALFADQLVAAQRVWTQTTFHSSLSDMRTEAEKAAILDELYSRHHSLVMEKDPESYRSDSTVSRLIARKV